MIMEERIKKLVEERGPLTGAELLEVVNDDPLLLWRTCRRSKDLSVRIISARYLRLDRRIEGYARLSPSILREFLTYTVIGLTGDQVSLVRKANRVLSHIEKVSREKSEIAYSVISTLTSRLGEDHLIQEQVCFIIAGDIVFNMAHDVPRPERSTGKLVRGSDMDIVVIVDDRFPERLMDRLDQEIYKEKYSLLLNPHLREEIDYIVKSLDRVREQVRFDSFRHMVACKILQEGTMLYGSNRLFFIIKSMLRENAIYEKIFAMEEKAKLFRGKAEEYLMQEDVRKIKKESLNLFYPAEESEEFE